MRALSLFSLCLIACGSVAGPVSDGSADAAPPGWKHGLVLVSSTTRGRVTAAFADAADGTPPMISQSRTEGPCRFVGYSTLGGPGTATPRSAGVLTVDGAAVPITLTPGATGAYPSFQSMTALWSGGEAITVAAAGGEVPSFSAHATAPTRVRVTRPAATPLTVPRAADFAVAWSGGAAGEVRVTFDADPSPGLQGAELECRFSSATGAGTIPAAALGLLPAGGAMLQIVAGVPVDLQAGDFAVEVAVISDAGYAGGMVTLE